MIVNLKEQGNVIKKKQKPNTLSNYLLSWFKIRTMRILFVFVFLSSVAFGQNDTIRKKSDLKKNIISANIGSAILFHDVGIKYQRIFSHNNIYSSLTVGQDFLRENFFNTENNFISSIRYGIIASFEKEKHTHYFELNLGIGFIQNNLLHKYVSPFGSSTSGGSGFEQANERKYFSPIGNFGYIRQSMLEPMVFKFGVGYPELLYIGLGVSF